MPSLNQQLSPHEGGSHHTRWIVIAVAVSAVAAGVLLRRDLRGRWRLGSQVLERGFVTGGRPFAGRPCSGNRRQSRGIMDSHGAFSGTYRLRRGPTERGIRMTRLLLVVAAIAALVTSVAGAQSAFPSRIDLPNGFQPEGIAIAGDQFYVGSIPTGAVYRGSLRTGKGAVLVPAAPGERRSG